ncbi:hypothetical protein KIN20_038138 [Parelaphostrongylus tenuis]|uniref:Phosphoinositide phospholipase C n=1 Tax=Parelaphostrongylus tenuis TaxID=148309 RepID=A0AAD5WMB4_PARTN|nr:hypothetical protein KIN20_038138 [Parelaphostrongylus tenuis]
MNVTLTICEIDGEARKISERGEFCSARVNEEFQLMKMAKVDEDVEPTQNQLDTQPFADRAMLRSSLIKHVNRQKSPGRKTVSFSSKKNDKMISNVSDCWHYMQNGTEFIKLRGPARHFRRFFSLDPNLSHIRWTPTNKKPHKARIAIEDIREIRIGKNTEQLRQSDANFADLQEECLFSVIYGDDYETLDLVASCGEDANIWVTGLMALTSTKYDCKPTTIAWATLRERWLGTVFDDEDPDQKGFIDENTAVHLIRQTNPTLSLNKIRNKVKEVGCSVDDTHRGKISRDEFIELYKEIATRPEVYFLMVRYANKDYMSCQDLRLFLETEQGMVGVTTQFCEDVVEKYEPAPEAKQNNFMTVDDCCVFDPSHSSVWMDMKQPFSKYFIASSNKTYIVDDQHGPVSVDGLTAALERNCRLIELDVWDPNESQGDAEPMVQNGMLATNKLPLSKALKTIRDIAFERTRYPLLLHLSVQCSHEWQKEVAKLLITYLGNKLYIPSTDTTDWSNGKNIPTPWDFQWKILIMGRRASDSSDGAESPDNGFSRSSRRISPRITLCKELSDLIPTFLQVKAVHDLMATAPNSSTMNPRKNVASLNESTALRLIHTYPQEFGQTTREYVVNVYPDASRNDSTNLNPQEFWNHGVQLVSLNYQTPGLMIDLQKGRFSENGECGYVLKPSIMDEELFVASEKPPTSSQILHLRILSGQQLPRPRGSNVKGDSSDPFVVIEIFGIPSDCAEERTKTVKNDGHNPSFDESFQFQVSIPELALVRFLVLDDEFIGDDFIGQYTIPFECLQPGFRHVPLLNNKGDPLPNATLFVHVAITNKRGGGKAKKRGMSVKRKFSRMNTGMKLVGIKVSFLSQWMNNSKLAVAPLCESIAMRSKLEAALVEWQEECGLGPAGTIRQGIRLIHSRMVTLAVNSTPPSSPSASAEISRNQEVPSFMIEGDDRNFPVIVVSGHIPDQMQRTFIN